MPRSAGAHVAWFAAFLLVLLGLSGALCAAADSEALEVTVRGRVVCLNEEMHRLHDAPLSTHHQHLYGFKARDGKFYTLLRTKFSEALFVEKGLQAEELILKGRVFPHTQLFAPTSIHSIHDGKECDVYYYCDICAIKSVEPGPCMCCQEPVELKEEPLSPSR